VRAEFWWGNMRARDHLEELRVGGSIILKSILNKSVWTLWTGFIWIRIGTVGGLL
jgi:hypothetical protein